MNKLRSLRRCVGCGEMKPRNELLRIVKTPSGTIFQDETGKADGRGAYICPNSECVKKAIKNRGLGRSLKTAVPKELLENLNAEMEKL
jgi:predicted RNA-binding protein YlxR (DUF448 family)